MGFYAYLILALDEESFAPGGGEDYMQTAQDIINAVPATVASSYGGWTPQTSNRNRYWIMENLLTSRMKKFRQAWYEYHRQGLDIMNEDALGGRAVIMKDLDDLLQTNSSYPNSMIVQMFCNAKRRELIEIFNEGTPQEKNKFIQIMSRIDPANASAYRAVR